MKPKAPSSPESRRPPSFPVTELDYHLPERLIAQRPAERRTDSRLLVLNRATGGLSDRTFGELVDFLQPSDLLVVNDTRVLPAKFRLQRQTGGRIEGLFLLERAEGVWEVLLRNAARLKPGEVLSLLPRAGGTPGVARAGEHLGQGRWLLTVEPAAPAWTVLDRIGRAPLPPYIRRKAEDAARDLRDAERYQTVYARTPGSVAAPTAGLHFTEELLDKLAAKGVERATLTLHVGLGTFAPVTVDDLAEHEMHAEWYALDTSATEQPNRRRAAGGRIVAVGTTSVRVLESCVDPQGRVQPACGWTRKFCYPPYEFQAVDALLTNFHLPRSTLLALVMAFAGVERIRDAYRHAVTEEYRFFSYGDAMLIL